MREDSLDIAFVGGGLASSLCALRMVQAQPNIKIQIFEKNEVLGKGHTWCFHDSDLSSEDLSWVRPFVDCHWPGYEVKFPENKRKFSGGYNAINSEKFNEYVLSVLGKRVSLSSEVLPSSDTKSIVTAMGRFRAKLVLDARGGFPFEGNLGFQKFVGTRFRFEAPHGLEVPLLKDATCPQLDGYRFFYLLPWSSHELLVEDTRYSDTPEVDTESYKTEIMQYCKRRGFPSAQIVHDEVGSLPIPIDGPCPVSKPWVSIGLRGGLFHAATGYSFPTAVRFATWLAHRDFSQTGEKEIQSWIKRHWREQGYFRMLNKLLFWGASPSERYRVLQKFYRHSPAFISSFYAGDFRIKEKIEMFLGRPPISILSAVKALSSRRVA